MRVLYFAVMVMLFLAGETNAQGKASVSSNVGRPNAVFLELPRNPDPCGAFLANMPPRYRNLTLQFGPVDLDTKTLFLLKCNEKKDELIETITGPIEELKSKAQGAVQSEIDRVRNDLTGGFWAFASQMMLEQLPAGERQKYAPGSDEALALAHEWLNDPSAEFGLYVDAYFSQPGNGSRLYEAYKAYIDVTNGESKAILDDLNGVLDRAKARLSQVLNANRAAESAAPDTPTTEILENVGLSGEWIDNFKSYEGQIRDFDKNWKVQEALGIMQGAFATDVPHDKVRAFFDLMNTMSSVASDSSIPLVSLVGDIIGSYAQIANQTLDAVLALGEKIKQRHGFCLGLGVATDDSRSGYFSDQGILACPMALKTWPFRHIYEAQEKQSGQLFFWDGSTFIPGENGGGRPAVLAALRLINAAGDLGYQLQKDPPDHVKLLAAVTNTAHPGGVPGLLTEADRIVGGLDASADRFTRALSLADMCSPEQVLQTAGDRADFSLSNFRTELKQNGTSRLIDAIAASFLAMEGTIGTGRRTEAFQTYFEAEERLGSLSFLILEGLVLDQNRRPVANAGLDVRVRAGEEARGCETWTADENGRLFVYAIGEAPGLAIDVRASSTDAADRSETFDIAHFRLTSRRIVEEQGALFARAPGEIILQIKVDPDPSEDPPEPEDKGEGASGDGDDPSTDDDVARAALCQAAQNSLDEALRLAGEGQFTAARALLETLATTPCAEIAAEAVGLGNEITLIVDEAMDRARVTAAQCEPAALHAAAESLDALDDPGARSLQAEISARIPALTSAIGVFEEARNGYKAGYLASARAGLIEARGLFEQLSGTPDCSRYLDRIATGIDKIDRLETALNRADEAIVSCDVGTISAFEGRFSELAEQHVLIAAKAATLAEARGNVSRVRSLITLADQAQGRGEVESAALFIADARSILDGPLSSSNCDTLRARLQNTEARQPEPDDGQTQAEYECAAMREMLARGESAYRDGRLGSARDIFATMVRVMPDAALLTGCEDVAGEAVQWSRHIAEAIALVSGVQRAIDRCDVAAFEGLEEKLARHPIDQALQAMARLTAARDSCSATDEEAEPSGSMVSGSDESDDPDLEENRTSDSPSTADPSAGTGEPNRPAPQSETSRDGSWVGTGQFALTAAGQRLVLDLRLDLTLSNGRSSGQVGFFNEGEFLARFPIAGTFDGSRIFHEDLWVYEELNIRNSFKGRFVSDTSIDGDGYLTLPEINCLANAIGEMAGGVAAGALGVFSDDDDGEDAPCPIARYPLQWSAQKQ
ncbi:MAG: hypothetical protein NXI27_15920 [Alphaproteobacteria bacterium]|nr:hypothetical protein [Alphaproteobacteria bacterium]